jgi:hypothetical protein
MDTVKLSEWWRRAISGDFAEDETPEQEAIICPYFCAWDAKGDHHFGRILLAFSGFQKLTFWYLDHGRKVLCVFASNCLNTYAFFSALSLLYLAALDAAVIKIKLLSFFVKEGFWLGCVSLVLSSGYWSA